MDFDLGWIKFGFDIVVGAVVALITVGLTLIGWRKADKKASSEALAAVKREIAKDLKGSGDDIEKIKERLSRGEARFARIEEKLEHMPTQKQFSAINSKLAALQASNKAMGNTVDVIRDHLLKGDSK